jgi:hypothetical protein
MCIAANAVVLLSEVCYKNSANVDVWAVIVDTLVVHSSQYHSDENLEYS